MKKLLTVVSILCVFLFSTSALAQARASQPLPDGPGKALVENICSSCHSVATITRAAGYSTAQQWHDLFSTMIELPSAQANTIAAYLAEYFPEDISRRPTLITGDVEIDIIEWTARTRPD